jgi:hypothetical protein
MRFHSAAIASEATSFSLPINPNLEVASPAWAFSTNLSLDSAAYPPDTRERQKGFCHWIPLTFVGACLTGAAALVAYKALIQVPQVDLNCDRARFASSRQRLSCAQQLANNGDLGDVVAALQLTRNWSTHHPLYSEAKPLLSRWSETLLRSARNNYDHSPAQARWLVAQVPPHSDDYGAARQLLHTWQQDYHRRAMALYGDAQAALKEQDWVGAIQAFQVLEVLEGERPELGLAKALQAQIQLERHAQHQLSTGIQLASKETPAGLEAAVNHLSQINHHTYAWQTAQPLLNRWGDRLLEGALDHWYAGELHTAIHLSQQVVANPERAQAAQDLIWLSQSRQLVLKSLEENPTTLAQTVGVYPALLVAGQISPESPFYPQAAASIPTWQSRVADAVTVSKQPSFAGITGTTDGELGAPSKTLILQKQQIDGFPGDGLTQTNRPQPGFNPEPFIAPKRSL